MNRVKSIEIANRPVEPQVFVLLEKVEFSFVRLCRPEYPIASDFPRTNSIKSLSPGRLLSRARIAGIDV